MQTLLTKIKLHKKWIVASRSRPTVPCLSREKKEHGDPFSHWRMYQANVGRMLAIRYYFSVMCTFGNVGPVHRLDGIVDGAIDFSAKKNMDSTPAAFDVFFSNSILRPEF